MNKKYILPNIRSILLQLHNPVISFKKLHFGNIFFGRFWKLFQSVMNNSNSYPSQKEILNYITSRNMRRTLIPTNFMNENKVQSHENKVKFLKKKGTLDLVLLNFKQSKKYFMKPASLKILKFHSKPYLLGNLVSKQSTKKETQEELEMSWGGPEIYKLITFIKNFDEVIEKESEVIVFFSAYWCQHCIRLRKPFGTAALMAKEAKLPVLFATFDITTDSDVALENGVVGIPLIKYYRQGKVVSSYRGKRTAEDLFEFVKNPSQLAEGTKKPDI